MSIKERLDKAKAKMRDKRLGKVMSKVGKEQEKKEGEFKNVVAGLDKQMLRFGSYANGLNKEIQELTKRVKKLEKRVDNG